MPRTQDPTPGVSAGAQEALPRRIVNPVQGDVVTFLETSAAPGGGRSLAELEVVPGATSRRTTT